jgi:hypothetical protein
MQVLRKRNGSPEGSNFGEEIKADNINTTKRKSKQEQKGKLELYRELDAR